MMGGELRILHQGPWTIVRHRQLIQGVITNLSKFMGEL